MVGGCGAVVVVPGSAAVGGCVAAVVVELKPVTAVVSCVVASVAIGLDVVVAGVVGFDGSVRLITIRSVASLISVRIEQNASWTTESPAHCP